MSNLQSFSNTPPDEENTDLAFVIGCPKCRSRRAYRVNDSIGIVKERKSAGMEWAVDCSKCGHRTTITLAWTKRSPGWTVRKIKLTEPVIAVSDEVGLMEERK